MLKVDQKTGDIYLTRGDSATLDLGIKKADGTPYDFSEDTVVFTIKKNTETADILVQKTFSSGSIDIDPGDTSGLKYGVYKYDVQVTTQAGKVYTVISPSDFEVGQEVSFE